mmetsp:Transcript_10165/g.15212  ORF Transcript_10165/g.15212 Transcript_10165/m.15212 type:complete len:250 (-) Transcript_10165:581-1330(-)
MHVGRELAPGGDHLHAAAGLAHDAGAERDGVCADHRPVCAHQEAGQDHPRTEAGAAHARRAGGADRRGLRPVHAGAAGRRGADAGAVHRGDGAGGGGRAEHLELPADAGGLQAVQEEGAGGPRRGSAGSRAGAVGRVPGPGGVAGARPRWQCSGRRRGPGGQSAGGGVRSAGRPRGGAAGGRGHGLPPGRGPQRLPTTQWRGGAGPLRPRGPPAGPIAPAERGELLFGPIALQTRARPGPVAGARPGRG